MQSRKKILVAPLNWGLGHATRCIPIIRELLSNKAEVLIAAEGGGKLLLKKEFPLLEQIELKGIEINYPKHNSFELHFALKLPQLIKSVKKENQLLLELVKKHQIDAIISDNRYGLYHPTIPSILITHQIFVRSAIFQNQLQDLIKKLISKFNACWVPDVDDEISLSGELAHLKKVETSIQFIGHLSRFSLPPVSKPNFERQVLVMLSGPEPHRTRLETELRMQLLECNYSCLIVRGLVEENQLNTQLSEKVAEVNFLESDQLQEEMLKSELVICRSGYSSIMDLVRLKKKALLIPTPGQSEQEYLAKHLQENTLFYFAKEKGIKLEVEIEKALNFRQAYLSNTNLKLDAIKDLIKTLN